MPPRILCRGHAQAPPPPPSLPRGRLGLGRWAVVVRRGPVSRVGGPAKQFYIFIREDITKVESVAAQAAINEDYEVTQAAARLDYKARQLLALSK